MDWLRKFMTGRYGSDQLSMVLLVLSLILEFLGSTLHQPALQYVAYIPLFFCIYRIFSKNISKRSMENYKFAMLMSPMYSWFKSKKDRLSDKTHKYYKCPNCKAILRVPKGKGKIKIVCRVCKTEFTKKT
ncbi:MAG: hypothetical protein N2Z65_01600 [Clostridiales bacterium]|nr:hypothetical protein [Clostridiales bacterium]